MPVDKYEYMLNTWGGFYNKEYQKIHGKKCGLHYFDTENDRDNYLDKLKLIEVNYNAKHLMFTVAEGFHTRTNVVAHRVCRHDGKFYHTKHEFWPCYSYSSALYHMEYKWYLGFNDYPLGEDFDYDKNQIEIIQEWISGAFSLGSD